MAQGNSDSTDDAARGPMDQFSAHLDRGWDLVNRGDLAGALLSAEQGLELDGQSPDAHNLVGYILAAQGDAEEALEHYRQALALDEAYVEAMLNAAEVLIHPLHDFDAAEEMVQQALDMALDDDEVADAMLIRFDAHMHKGDREGASAVVAQLPRGPFENARLDFLVGHALLEMEQLDAAEPLLRSALERDPEQADAHYFMGHLLEAREDSRNATLSFLRSRALDLALPESPHALPMARFEERASQAALELPRELAALLRDALLIVSDVPGVELVADGVDPRAPIVLDAVQDQADGSRQVGRIYLYKRNIERHSEGVWNLQDEIRDLLQAELATMIQSCTS